MWGKHFFKVLSLILLFVLPAWAKEYEMPEIQIQATVSAEGTLKIAESRTYLFRGPFSWADYRLPLDKLGQVKNFRLYEGVWEYTENQDQQLGTYTLTQSPSEFYVRWYFQARDQIRTFKVEYEITDAVVLYNDLAELYFKFVGEDNPKTVSKAEIWLDLPQAADTNLVKAWAHGPLNGQLAFQDNRLHYLIAPLPAHKYWETRVIFPKNWITGSTKYINEDRRARVLEEESAWASDANRQREQERRWAAVVRQISLALCAAGLIVWLFLFIKFGRSFSVPYTQEIDPNYPQDLPPAVVSALYYDKQVYAAALSSTLFDLARKGFISLEQQSLPARKWWQFKKDRLHLKLNRDKFVRERSGLLDFEYDLLVFLFDRIGNGVDELDAKVLEKNSGKVRSWFKKWSKLLKGHYQSIPLYDKESTKATVISFVFSVLIIITGVVLAIFLHESALLAVLGGVVCAGLSFTILRYTPEMKLRKKQWRAFRRYIKTYQVPVGDIGSKLSVMNQYLVYALALGVGGKELGKILAVVPENEYPVYFPWFIAASHGVSPVGSLAASMSTMINIANSTLSSATGAGGGATAGGGGGAGGAAGGAG
jgi:uncharacterized membrane protein